MSIKVYEAYQINLKDLNNIIDILKSFVQSVEYKKYIVDYFENKDKSLNIVYRYIDKLIPHRFFQKKEKTLENIINYVFQNKKDFGCYSNYPIAFIDNKIDGLIFIPYKSKCIIYPLFTSVDFSRLVLEKLPIKDFRYWNDSNKPNDVTLKEWNNRKNTRTDIMKYNGKLQNCGLLYSFNLDYIDYRFFKDELK